MSRTEVDSKPQHCLQWSFCATQSISSSDPRKFLFYRSKLRTVPYFAANPEASELLIDNVRWRKEKSPTECE